MDECRRCSNFAMFAIEQKRCRGKNSIYRQYRYGHVRTLFLKHSSGISQ